MRRTSRSLPNQLHSLPDLCPTFAQPQFKQGKALPDLPNLFARAYMDPHNLSSNKKTPTGRVGWVSRVTPSAATVSLCPTSAQPADRSGKRGFTGIQGANEVRATGGADATAAAPAVARVLLGLGRLRVIRTPLFMHLSFRALVPNGTGMAA